jgi:hypothetical protein
MWGLVDARRVCKERIMGEQSGNTGDSVNPTIVISGAKEVTTSTRKSRSYQGCLAEPTSHLIFAYWV